MRVRTETASRPAVVRVAVADADRLRREAVCQALQDVEGVAVVATVGQADAVAAAAAPGACDVLLLALRMGQRSMLLDVAELATRCKVVLVADADPDAVAAVRAGAVGGGPRWDKRRPHLVLER
jgi:DNA-binding NarL/FixJ family response regulator